jgi:hypothetical protein
MSRLAGVCVIALLVGSPSGADETDGKSSVEIVVADELRSAFYEHAPRSLASAMRKAVVSWCSSNRDESHADAVNWLCQGGELAYFRSVYPTGAKGGHGLVCEDNSPYTPKFIGMDAVAEVVADGSCVRAESDGSAYELYVDEVGGGDA